MIFVQSVTAAEMQQLLDEIDGSIAAGPSDVGRYTVRLETERAATPMSTRCSRGCRRIRACASPAASLAAGR